MPQKGLWESIAIAHLWYIYIVEYQYTFMVWSYWLRRTEEELCNALGITPSSAVIIKAQGMWRVCNLLCKKEGNMKTCTHLPIFSKRIGGRIKWKLIKATSPLDCKEIQPVHPKGNQPWIFIGRTDAEAETPVLWPPDVNNWLICKDPDAWKDWRWEKKGMTENVIVRWHHQLYVHEFE